MTEHPHRSKTCAAAVPDRDTSSSAKTAILQEALRQAAASGLNGIRIETILEQAHAFSSSLYHHFRSRSGLIEAVREEQQRISLSEEDPSLLGVLDSMTSPAEFSDYIADQLYRIATDPATIQRRRERLDARGYAVLFMSLSMGQMATDALLEPERWLMTATPAALAPLRF